MPPSFVVKTPEIPNKLRYEVYREIGIHINSGQKLAVIGKAGGLSTMKPVPWPLAP